MIDYKKKLILAYDGEMKAQQIYDECWASFNASQRQNIQRTLVEIFFTDSAEFSVVEQQYRKDKSALSANQLKTLQVFYRAAMAFSRRKTKELECVDTALEQSKEIGDVESPANAVSETKPKQKRGKKDFTKEDCEKAILKIISVIDRDDVKSHLKQALTLLKLGVPVSSEMNTSIEELLEDMW